MKIYKVLMRKNNMKQKFQFKKPRDLKMKKIK